MTKLNQTSTPELRAAIDKGLQELIDIILHRPTEVDKKIKLERRLKAIRRELDTRGG